MPIEAFFKTMDNTRDTFCIELNINFIAIKLIILFELVKEGTSMTIFNKN